MEGNAAIHLPPNGACTRGDRVQAEFVQLATSTKLGRGVEWRAFSGAAVENRWVPSRESVAARPTITGLPASAAALLLPLHGGTRHTSVGAKHAAVPRLGGQRGLAGRTVPEVPATRRGHVRLGSPAALRTPNGRSMRPVVRGARHRKSVVRGWVWGGTESRHSSSPSSGLQPRPCPDRSGPRPRGA